jgi:hypothetical protein
MKRVLWAFPKDSGMEIENKEIERQKVVTGGVRRG